MEKRIHRSRTDRVLAGVASGLARHFKTDPVLIRVLFVALAFAGGGGVLAYIIMWAIIPEEPLPYFGSQASANEEAEPFREEEFNNAATKETNQKGSIIAGVILIALGALFLADEFLPRFDFGKYWPLLLVAIGVALLVTSKKNKAN